MMSLTRRSVLSWVICSLALAMPLSGCGTNEPVGVSKASVTSGATLSLQIVDIDGRPIPSAAVTVRGAQGTTDDSGWVSFPDLEPGYVAVGVKADGFVSATTARTLAADDASVTMRLLSRGAPTSFDASAEAVIEHGGVRVTIPPRVLITKDGAVVTGSVDATVVEIDPTVVPEDAYPAPLIGRRANKKDFGTLISLGMTEVHLTQGGQEVEIAPDQSVTLELTLSSALVAEINPGEIIPQWTVSPDGLWDETGSGTVMTGPAGTTTWTTPLSSVSNGKNCDVFDRPISNPNP